MPPLNAKVADTAMLIGKKSCVLFSKLILPRSRRARVVPTIVIWPERSGWRATVIVSFSAVDGQRRNDEAYLT